MNPQDELMKLALETTRIPQGYYDFADSIALPTDGESSFTAMTKWEQDAEKQCSILLMCNQIAASFDGKESEEARAINDLARRTAADAIGAIVAEQMLKGFYHVPGVITEGMDYLQQGKGFKPSAGRQKSTAGLLVLHAFYFLQSEGISAPSQTEVRKLLKDSGHSMSKERISRFYDDYGLKWKGSDARGARSEAGKRKRGVT
jgi:hypothetical protein